MNIVTREVIIPAISCVTLKELSEIGITLLETFVILE